MVTFPRMEFQIECNSYKIDYLSEKEESITLGMFEGWK
jgi:hypothetical protein